ncbi:MAG: 5-oxoprolinase subunit PxpB [Chthoniobacterales bacterium]
MTARCGHVKITPLGDAALLIDFAAESSDAGVLLQRALSAASALERAQLKDVVEVTSAYQSIALFLDRSQTTSKLKDQISAVVGSTEPLPATVRATIDIPVCYDAEFALDAQRVANETQLSFSNIIDLHTFTEFTVACLGFMPGFPYLAGLPKQLHVPRLPTPRTKVPAGSVAVANAQAGIYPFESPGGWNIIGRTPLRLFDASNTPPALLAPGDRVRFRLINRAEFDVAASNET